MSLPLPKANQETFKVAKKCIFCHSAKPESPHVLPGPPGLAEPTRIRRLTACCADGSKPPRKPWLPSDSFDVGKACHHVWVSITGQAPPHPLHPHRVPKRLLPQGRWHSAPERIRGARAHVRAHRARTQHRQTAPRFSRRSHFQHIFNMAWSAPVKGFVGYVKQTQGTPCLRQQNLLLPSPPLLKKPPG